MEILLTVLLSLNLLAYLLVWKTNQWERPLTAKVLKQAVDALEAVTSKLDLVEQALLVLRQRQFKQTTQLVDNQRKILQSLGVRPGLERVGEKPDDAGTSGASS